MDILLDLRRNIRVEEDKGARCVGISVDQLDTNRYHWDVEWKFWIGWWK